MAKRTYELRPWGRPMGIVAGCATLAVFSPLLQMPSQAFAAYQSGDFVSFIAAAMMKAFIVSFIWSSLGLALVWWWLDFMG